MPNPFPPPVSGFSVVRRNFGHWDISGTGGRWFRIRGGPGKFLVLDERHESLRKPTQEFRTATAAMTYITDTLMFELIVAEGQEPSKIEGWNVTP